jgi:integral membrane protein
MKNNAVHRLRLISFPEGLSFVLLLICVVLKSTTSFNAVPVLGMVHGILFTFYVLFALLAWWQQRWSFWRAVWIMALSVLPFGGFYAERILAREEVLGFGPAEATA